MIKKNENIYDRIVRVLLGLALAYVAYYQVTGVTQIVLYVLAFAALVTGLIGYCHLYTILKISTLKKKEEKVENKEVNE